MSTYYVRHNDGPQVRSRVAMVGEVDTVSIDFSPWAEDNGAITSVAWTVKAGSATVSGEALASNVASAQVTTSSAGGSMIKVDATGATNSKVVHLRILTKDPYELATDYEFRG